MIHRKCNCENEVSSKRLAVQKIASSEKVALAKSTDASKNWLSLKNKGSEKVAYSKSNCSTVLYRSNYNLGQNICRLFHFSAQFFFTVSETELDYYHQKVSVQVASRVAERLKT